MLPARTIPACVTQRQVVENGTSKPKRQLPLFKSWVFEWEEMRPGRVAFNVCLEFLVDDRVSSLFASCADYLLRPDRTSLGKGALQVKRRTRSRELHHEHVS